MKVAILGFGKEGKAALRYFREKNADVTVFDESPAAVAELPAGVHKRTGKDCFKKASGFDVVVRGPAIRPDRIKTDGKITDVTKLFFTECPAPIIGVTGTKGKGTVSSLIFEMLKSAGLKAHLAGNIGVPALDILPDVRAQDVVVLELSSFQLWQLDVSPQVAVVLMIEPDHLDVHKTMDEYLNAKANIARWQKAEDLVVYHPANVHSAHIAQLSHGHKLRYGVMPAAHIEDDAFVIDEHKVCSTSDLLIPGKHNIENVCAALTAAWQYTQDTAALRTAISHFRGLEHRLELVRTVGEVTYYNDSFSSAPGASIAAIQAFAQPEILICGGYDKHVDFEQLAQAIKTQKNIKKVLLIGQTKERIAASLEAAGFTHFEIMKTKDFARIVETARDQAAAGDVVILSPACASFGMFKNFYDRGEQFKQIVREFA